MLLKFAFQHADQNHTLEIKYNFTFAYAISSSTPYDDVTIWLDGNYIGSIANGKEIKAGKEFLLPLENNPVLKIKVSYSFPDYLWIITLNGQPVPGTMAHPLERLKASWVFLIILAGLDIGIGLTSYILAKMNMDYLMYLGFGLNSVIWGIIYAILSIFVWHKSTVALGIALAIYILETAEFIYNETIVQNTSFIISLTVTRLFLVPLLFYGFKAIRELKQSSAK